MKYLRLTIQENLVNVQQLDQEQVTLTKEYSYDAQNLLKTLSKVAHEIKTDFTNFVGGLITGGDPTYFYLSTLKNEQEFINLEKLFSEQTNVPFIADGQLKEADILADKFSDATNELTWGLDYEDFYQGKEEYSAESLLTIGNGFFALRGTTPEMKISSRTYPGTYLASLYNQLDSQVADQTVTNEDFVNAPNGQYISIKAENADWINLDQDNVIEMKRTLNFKNGLFESAVIVEDQQNNRFKIITKKIVNMAKVNEYAIEYQVTPLNYTGQLAVKTQNDGSVINGNVERYAGLSSKHLKTVELETNQEFTQLHVQTTQSKIDVIQKTKFTSPHFDSIAIDNHAKDETITQTAHFSVEANQSYVVEKSVQIFASHNAIGQTTDEISALPFSGQNFADILTETTAAWQKLWAESDISLSGDLMSQKLLRLHTYHLLVSASPTNEYVTDASITARGLHGEAYRGHIFWDEIFILPFYTLHFPEQAKRILMYRYNRLGAAKANAEASGYEGAMFPWQSGLDGSEETQKLHVNPLDGKWHPDYSSYQRHVSLAIAYNVWSLWHVVGDEEFMADYGLEMLLEISKFWLSLCVYNETNQRYDIHNVMGPDEFHEHYHDSDEGGLTNNAYTNMMVVWLFEEIENSLKAVDTERSEELLSKVGLTADQLASMKKIRSNLTLEINQEGIISQFQGYFNLKEVDWDYYQEKYGNIYRMDRILLAEGKSADDYKVAKQADTLMTFYNFDKERIDEILADLNYQMPADYLDKNLKYYLERTSHGSTLSRIVHAELADSIGQQELGWKLYQEALFSDYNDIQGGTTAEGIHTGVMAATIHVTTQTYAGIDTRGRNLVIQPNLPAHWTNLACQIHFRGTKLALKISNNEVTMTADQTVTLIINHQSVNFVAEQPQTIKLT